MHQIGGDLGLPINGDAAAAAAQQIDTLALTVQGQFEAVMQQAFALQPLADASALQQFHTALLQYPGADARQHMLGRLPLDDDAIDAGEPQQFAQQQARWPGADDRNLRSHALLLAWMAMRAVSVAKALH